MNDKTQMMNSMKIILITLVGIALLAFKCRDEDCHDEIKIVNNSNHAIYYSRSYRYPDTLLVYNPVVSPTTYKIKVHSSKLDQNINGCFEGQINDSPGGKIMFFIYDANTLETTPWDTIVKHYIILKRYDLTEQDLDSMGWTITYQ